MRALMITAFVLYAGVAHARFPIDDNTVSACETGCIATDPSGALLCIVDQTMGDGYSCVGQWHEVGNVVGAREVELIEPGGGREGPSYPKSAQRELNKRKKAVPVAEVFRCGPLKEGAESNALADNGASSLECSSKELRILRDGYAGVADLSTTITLDEGETMSVKVYPFGADYLAMVTVERKSDESEGSSTNFIPFVGSPGGKCTAEASCPADYAVVQPYFASYCSQTFEDADLTNLESLVQKKEVSLDALVALFNLHGAMYGYEFKMEKWLNAFYYGQGTWLPAACRGLVKKYTKAAEVPLVYTKPRDAIRKIWQAAKNPQP